MAESREVKKPAFHFRQFGPDALLVYFAEKPGIAASQLCRTIERAIEAHQVPGLVEVTPAFTSLLLEFDQPIREAAPLAERLREILGHLPLRKEKEHLLLEVLVQYDGPDLQRVAENAGKDVAEVIELHSKPIYTVAILGFAPGFPYLLGLDARLHTPRLASPRPRITAGAVGIGGAHTGIYTTDSPGGWNIIGRTDGLLYRPLPDPATIDELVTLKPGDRVRFIPR